MDVGWNRGSPGAGPSSFRTVVHLRPARSIFLPWCAVLSIAKLALGQEAYYEQQVALGLDEAAVHCAGALSPRSNVTSPPPPERSLPMSAAPSTASEGCLLYTS